MKRAAFLVMVFLVAFLGAAQEKEEKKKGKFRVWLDSQDKIVLAHASYLYLNNGYLYNGTGATGGLPAQDFRDVWHSVGAGSTGFIGGKQGLYTVVTWNIPIGYRRFTADGNTTSGTFSNFRFGNDAIIGWGWAPNRGGKAGILLGGGLHTNFAYFYTYPALNDPHTTFLELGIGAGFHGYVKVSPTAAIHVGITGSFDFLQIFFGSNQFYINSYRYGLGGGITILIGAGWVARRGVGDEPAP
jgi:hypothetical protein